MKIRITEDLGHYLTLKIGEIITVLEDKTCMVYGENYGEFGCGGGYITIEQKLKSLDEWYEYEIIEGGKAMNNNNNNNTVEPIYTKKMMENMGIESILYNDDATVVKLSDGRKGVSVVDSTDDPDRLIGIAVAYAYAMGTNGSKTQFKKNMIKVNKHQGYKSVK